MSFSSFINMITSIIHRFPPMFAVIIVSGLTVLVALAVKRIFF